MSPKWVRGGERPEARLGVILRMQAYELHGTPYYAVLYRLDTDPPDGAREARLSADMIYADPRAGDRVLIESVLGVVDRMRKDEPT